MRAAQRRRLLYLTSVVVLGVGVVVVLSLAWLANVEQRAAACKLLPSICAEK